MPRVRRFFREPLLHFLLLGALLFVLHRAWQGLQPSDRLIVITPALHADLERELAVELGRAPDAAELAAALETWKSEEVLFREGVRLGLDDDDPLVRRRSARRRADANCPASAPGSSFRRGRDHPGRRWPRSIRGAGA